jgi:hypothetical protein
MRPDPIPLRTPEGMAEHYITTRQTRRSPVSTAEAIRAMRTVLRDCPLTDRELADMVARSAIRHGLNVHFDTGETHRGFLAAQAI